MWEKMIEYELRYDPGVPMDTLIVMNGDCDKLDHFDWTKTPGGRLMVRHRENTGGSFGGYNYAYKFFDYPYDLFTEDDLFVYGDNYGVKLIERFKKLKCGFLALIGVATYDKHHAHGGVGITSRQVLQKVFKGDLPHYGGLWDKQAVIDNGEIEFTYQIKQTGMSLEAYGDDSWSPDNLIMPYYDLQ